MLTPKTLAFTVACQDHDVLEHKLSLSWFSWSCWTIAKAFENRVLPLRLDFGIWHVCAACGCARPRCGVLVSPIGMYAVGLSVSIRMELGFKFADMSLSRVDSSSLIITPTPSTILRPCKRILDLINQSYGAVDIREQITCYFRSVTQSCWIASSIFSYEHVSENCN